MSIKSAKQRLRKARWAIEEMEESKQDKERHQWKFSTFLADARDSMDHLSPSKYEHEVDNWSPKERKRYTQWYQSNVANHFDSKKQGSPVLQWLHETNVQDKHYNDPVVEHADAITADCPAYRTEEVKPDIYLGDEEEHAYHLKNHPPGWGDKRIQQVAQDIVDEIQVKIFDQLEYQFGAHL